MPADGFLVRGSRPPSALSNHRPGSATSKQGYHVVARSSMVDESLFSSQHPTRQSETFDFKAPWECPKPQAPTHIFGAAKTAKTKIKPLGHPLLWSPTPGTAKYTRDKAKTKLSQDNDAHLWSTRDHFRQLKHSPSFVDESLFGPRLKEPTFEAPWSFGKVGENNSSNQYVLTTTGVNTTSSGTVSQDNTMIGSGACGKRPATALGASRHKIGHCSQETRPVWKP